MIDGSKSDGYILTCDFCGNEVKYFDTFDEAKEYKKEHGWESKYKDMQWNDVCYQCIVNNNQNLKRR